MLWDNTAYWVVELSGEDLSRFSNKIELVSLRKCPYYYYLTRKVTESDVTITHNSQSMFPHHGRKTAGIDMV